MGCEAEVGEAGLVVTDRLTTLGPGDQRAVDRRRQALAGALLGHGHGLEPRIGPPRVLQPLGLGDARHNAVPLQGVKPARGLSAHARSEEHTSELQSLMSISY